MLERCELLVPKEKLELFCNKKILLVGLGGVGGSAFMALVRMGIKEIDVIDNDTFSLSNLNRQVLSYRDNIGKEKVSVALETALRINPDIKVNTYNIFLTKDNISMIDFKKYDYIIDCIDTISTKFLLISEAISNNVKIISSCGTGNRLDPTKLILTDIWKTSYDPVAKVLRKMLRDNGIKYKLPVLCSTEIPKKLDVKTIGSVNFVPNVAGIYIASYVFNDIIFNGSDSNEG